MLARQAGHWGRQVVSGATGVPWGVGAGKGSWRSLSFLHALCLPQLMYVKSSIGFALRVYKITKKKRKKSWQPRWVRGQSKRFGNGPSWRRKGWGFGSTWRVGGWTMTPSWHPITKLSCLVKDNKIKSMENIYLFSLPIKEYQIVDFFLPKLKDEVMKIMPIQKQTCAKGWSPHHAVLASLLPLHPSAFSSSLVLRIVTHSPRVASLLWVSSWKTLSQW